MRILVVSAHWPPNFVSGATLVAHRAATELGRRGHGVSVYTGWRGDSREAPDRWDGVDDDGTPIRWVVTTPWLSDLDRHQYDNPDVAADFGFHLEKVRPDLVHFHSVQGLGAGVLHEAADRGIPMLVTMHDFWWWCARMFLCDTEYRPCAPVVECSACGCSGGREWLDARRRFTVGALDRADRVIVPSEIAAAVARANGVDPARLRVVENGLPEVTSPVARIPGETGVPVRFLYAGGPDRMKGPDVLAQAARLLADVPGWRLSAYGFKPWREAVAGLPFDVQPAFEPERVDAVMAQADVLVVPSVMRESYSILTREALSRSVPVISTDCLGPEEVVEDGRNGLLVPSADPVALAEAMKRLVDDPTLLETLRSGTHLDVLPIQGHVDQLEELYSETVAGRGRKRVQRSRPKVDRVLYVVGIDGAPLRYRARFPGEALEALGVHTHVRHYRHPDISALGEHADVVVMYRVPATVQVLQFMAEVRRQGGRLLFDVDDLIFDPSLESEIPALSILPPREAAEWMEGVRRYRATMEFCDAFCGSTPQLVEHAEKVLGMPGWCLPNGYGRVLAQLSDEAARRPRDPGPPRIGYLSGTDTHDHDWQMVEASVSKVLDSHPDAELWLVGLIEPSAALDRHRERVVRRPLLPWTELPSVLRNLDVNLAPLVGDSRFNDAKSAIKWMEAALVGTPTVASPTRAFCEAIEEGRNGLLASTEGEWYRALDRLLREPATRTRLGSRARRDALLASAPALQGRRALAILEGVVDLPERGPHGDSWKGIDVHEPFAPFELEPYPPPAPTDPKPVTMARRISDTWLTVKTSGWRAGARRVVRYALRPGRALRSGRR